MLEDHLPKSRYEQPGERVVQGQRMMQAASDIFLGWTKGVKANRYLYWRQLRDMKGSVVVENDGARRRSTSTPASAAGRWRGPTPDPATRSPSPPTSARKTGSTKSITDFSRTLRRPERTRLPGLHRRHPIRPTRGTRRRLTGAVRVPVLSHRLPVDALDNQWSVAASAAPESIASMASSIEL